MNQNVADFQKAEESPAFRVALADDELSEFELEMIAAGLGASGHCTRCGGNGSSQQ